MNAARALPRCARWRRALPTPTARLHARAQVRRRVGGRPHPGQGQVVLRKRQRVRRCVRHAALRRGAFLLIARRATFCACVCSCVVCVRVPPLFASGRRVAGRAHQRLRHADVRRRRQVRGAVGGRENERPGHVHLRRRRQVRRRVEGRPAARQGHGHLPRRRRRGGGEVRGRLVRGQDARPRPLRLRRQRRVPGPVGGLENVRQGHVRLPQRQQVRGRVGGRRQGRLRRAHVRQRRAL